ncbi:MAG: surface carbohydrate biosynthesis protein [Rhodospirillaceae bacterium]
MVDVGAALQQAIAAGERGDLGQAQQLCREVLRRDPRNAGAHHLTGLIAFRTRQPIEAVRYLETAAALAPANGIILIDLAEAYESAGRMADAWAFFEKAMATAPGNGQILGRSVGFLVRVGQNQGLFDLCRRAIAAGWRDFGTLLPLGELLIHRLQYVEAEEIFREALVADPKSVKALRGRGFALSGLHRFPEAVELLQTAVALSPGQPWGQIYLAASLGGLALSQGGWLEANAFLGRALDLERAVLPQTVPAPGPRPSGSELPPVHRVVYMEIELRAREFEARALLAIHAAARGLDVVLGQKAIISKIGYDQLPTGMVLVKTMNGNDVAKIQSASKAGHMVVVLDEEAFGGCGKRPLWLRLNTDPSALARTDLIVAQGDEYRDLLTAVFPDVAPRTLVLGNPRVDLYRAEFRKPRPDNGARRHILVCSQSQVSNPRGLSFPDLIGLHMRGVPMGEDIGREVIAGTKEVIAFEISMIPQLQAVTAALTEAFPETPVLFRPHPAEDATIWEQAFASFKTVTVSSAGALTDALLDAKAMVYVRGCATGLEAHLQGVPIVRFDGDGQAPEPGNWISSNLGFPAKSPADVVAAVRRIDTGENTQTGDKAVVSQSFHSDGDRLVCVGVAAGLAKAIEPRLLPKPSARAQLAALANVPQAALRDFDEIKFPATSVAEVRELAERLARVAGLPVPRIEAVAHNVFLFRADGPLE